MVHVCCREKQASADQTLSYLSASVRNFEQYSRKHNLGIVGVPYSTGENIYKLIKQIASLVDVKYGRAEITTARRLQAIKERSNPSSW